jgi:hypothetical protein
MATQDPHGGAITGSPAVAQVLNCEDAPWLEALLKDRSQKPKDTTTVFLYSNVHLNARTDFRSIKHRFREATYHFIVDQWNKLNPSKPPLSIRRDLPRFGTRKYNRITTEFTVPTVLAEFLATQLGAPTGETTIADWGVCGYKIGDAQPLRTFRLINIPDDWDEEITKEILKRGFNIELANMAPYSDDHGVPIYNAWNGQAFNQWIIKTNSPVMPQVPYRLDKLPGGQALEFRFLPYQTLPNVMVDIPVTQGPSQPLTTGNQGDSPSYLEIAKGLIQALGDNAQPNAPPKRRQPNPRTRKAQNKGQKENIPHQSTHIPPQEVTQPIQSRPPQGPRDPAADQGNEQPQTEAPEEQATKENSKDNECTDINNQGTDNASEQITDNQESIIEIQDTPMEGQEHEGGEKRSTEERSPSISQDLSPTKKSKRQTKPPQRMLDYETGEATA